MKESYLQSKILLFIFLICFSTSCSGQSTSNGSLSNEQAKIDKVSELINTYAAYGDFNGAVLVAHDDKVIYRQGHGLANMEWNIPNEVDTKFRLGSVTKQFTAMVIIQLVAEGVLDLHKPISTYLPDYPKENGDKITIHHLMTHSSGTPNSYDTPHKKTIRPDNHAPKELVQRFSDLPLEFRPGEKFTYSNSGYVVLGLIIEEVTKKTFEQVVKERIFTPLKMKHSGIDKHRPLIKNRASGYFKNWGDYYNANYLDMSNVYTAGALYSTVEDLYRWDRALYTEQLVPQKYMDLIFTEHIPDPDYGGSYGYGWSIKNKPLGKAPESVKTIGHDGAIDGFCTIFTRIPSSRTTIILLSNIRRAPLNAMTKGIMGILYDKPFDPPKKSLAYSMLDVINEKDITAGVQYFRTTKGRSNNYLSEDEMNIVSYKLLQSDRANAAAAVLRLGIEAFPEAFNLYDSYGEVLRMLGQKEAAIKNYKKSVQLNPSNENGIRMLKEMGVE